MPACGPNVTSTSRWDIVGGRGRIRWEQIVFVLRVVFPLFVFVGCGVTSVVARGFPFAVVRIRARGLAAAAVYCDCCMSSDECGQ